MISKRNLCNMTHEETIRALDELIVYLNGSIVQKNITQNTKRYIIDCLIRNGISKSIINTVNSIEIKENAFSYLAQYNSDVEEYEKKMYEKNRLSIQSILNILTIEKTRLVDEDARQRAVEEQKKNNDLQEKAVAEQKEANMIQKRALCLSAIATVASVIATIVSIIALVMAI